MKARSLCASTLVAILGVTVLGAATPAFAAPTELTSEGTVKVTEGTAGGTDTPTVDPEKPGEVIPPTTPGVTPNPDTGSLTIEKTTVLNFGTISTSANTVNAYAAPISFKNTANEDQKRGAFVQWADVRAGGKYGYTITAQMTQQFTSGTNVLSGSTIDFSNGIIAAQGDNTNTIPSNVQTAFQLTEASDDAKTVVTADKTKKEGKGRYTMAFGEGTTAEPTAENSVKLTVPAATASNMSVGDYTATVTWKITAAPESEVTPEG